MAKAHSDLAHRPRHSQLRRSNAAWKRGNPGDRGAHHETLRDMPSGEQTKPMDNIGKSWKNLPFGHFELVINYFKPFSMRIFAYQGKFPLIICYMMLHGY